MAEQPSTVECEELPREEAGRRGRVLCINPERYRALQQTLPSLGHTAACLTIPEGTSPITVQHRIPRVAAMLSRSVTIRNVPEGLLC